MPRRALLADARFALPCIAIRRPLFHVKLGLKYIYFLNEIYKFKISPNKFWQKITNVVTRSLEDT
jgi:hypothetical protein